MMRYDGTSWTEFNGFDGFTVGTGGVKDGNTINIVGGNGITANQDNLELNVDSNIFEFNTESLGLKDDGIGVSKLKAAIAGEGLDYNSTTGIAVKYDDVTVGIDGNGDLYLKQTYIQENAIDGSTIINDSGVFKVGTITSTQLANNAVTAAKLNAGVAGAGLEYNSTTGLAVKVDDVSVEINGDGNVAVKFGDAADYDAGTVGVRDDPARR